MEKQKSLTKEKVRSLLEEIISERSDRIDEPKEGKDKFYYFNIPQNDLDLLQSDLRRISNSDNPTEELNEMIHRDLEFSYSCDVLQPELTGYVTQTLEQKYSYSEKQIWKHIDFIDEWIADYCYAEYPKEYQNIPVPVVIALDTGDRNYVFSINTREAFCKESSFYWLAKQQENLNELQDAIKNRLDSDDESLNPFVKSVLEEMDEYNLSGMVCFLTTMGLLDFIQLKEVIQSEEKLNKSFHYEERSGEKEFIVSKDSPCGLYHPDIGGGSLFEIELSKDVKIPTKAVCDIWIDTSDQFGGCNGRGCDISCCYGMAADDFSGTCQISR